MAPPTAPGSTAQGHGPGQASDWIRRFAPLVPAGGAVLDVACGSGRHLRWFAARGHPVTGVDRDAQALMHAPADAECIQADIENGPWPLEGRSFAGVVVTHYLWRALMPRILEAVAPGGVLLYETFAAGNETVGRPSRPDFLLQPGELLRLCAGFRVVAYEDGFLREPDRFVQRIAAVRPDPLRASDRASDAGPVRHPLWLE
ncbi:MAG: class I SAM-dependent methyltransferase [Burkholderiaceae bacterium]